MDIEQQEQFEKQENQLRESRHLATVQLIADVKPHPNADALELAQVLGWHVCVRKGEYQPGDLTVYCEIDSVMPEVPEFEFLRMRKFRIRTLRLRGELSQGICVNPQTLIDGPTYDVRRAPGLSKVNLDGLIWKVEGQDAVVRTVSDDVSDLLGVTKYNPPIPACLSGVARGNFPSFISKTDEARIQSQPWLLQQFADRTVDITEKLDGSSVTVYLREGDFGVCSRNLNLKETEGNTFWQVVREIGLQQKLQDFFGDNVALQGELIGPGIQKNKYNLDKPQIRWFNFYNISDDRWYGYRDMVDAIEPLGLTPVPLLASYIMPPASVCTTVDQMVERSEGVSALNSKQQREGIVVRTQDGNARDNRGRRMSFKVINPQFLLQEKD